MSDNILVRASRDGDQFHYLWAARRCLRLLSPKSELVAVTIEGASPSEASTGNIIEAGEELIDVAEYYGTQDVANAKLVRYIQLKHSTLQANDPWPPSGLEKTLSGFAQRYKEFRKRAGSAAAIGNLEFRFVTNRPIGSDLVEAAEDAAAGAQARHPAVLKKLRSFTRLRGLDLRAFCNLLKFNGSEEGYWDQRNILHQDLTAYLPEADADAPIQLKELVTRKALSESAGNPAITKIDVLRALKTDESSLFPATCRIEHIKDVVPREQEGELVDEIVRAGKKPVIVHAAGGVGKSVFSTRIHNGFPEGSVSILYDCFGNGQYRNPSGYCHRHKTALVQIANELASQGLCDLLIPSPSADSAAYMKAFLHRLRQSINRIKARSADALLCIIVDAADNAQLAADEISEGHSFVRDLLREEIPDGVRLIALCRTHRQNLLDPPPDVVRLELQPFSLNETAAHLRGSFPEATDDDIAEFHTLSSQNPRVQAIALSEGLPLDDVLRNLGPSFTTIDMAIERLLDQAVERVRDRAGSVEKAQIDRICAGLAALRPLVPISVLASMSGVDESAIRSFAFDLRRPLLVTGGTIQFLDEPAETWFRERFKPKGADLAQFIQSLKPLAVTSSYVASALPQLMLEAGCFTELVDMALSSKGLPTASPIERRDVELQRLQFALKASLRMERYTEAAKLALKAGGETAGNQRQSALLQANTDLAAVLLDSDRIQEIVSRRTFGSLWMGSHHAYEAGLMSGCVELLGDARSRLRMAEEWLWNWSQLPDKERAREGITNAEIAEMAIAHFNIHGPIACARFLRRWKPRVTSFRAGQILARAFVDHGRYSSLDELAHAAGADIWLVLAITLELNKVHRTPPTDVFKRTLTVVSNPRVTLAEPERFSRDEAVLQAVTALVEAAYKLSACDVGTLVSILSRYMPDSPPRAFSPVFGSTLALMRAYALRAALVREPLVLTDLAHTELRKELEHRPNSDTQQARQFRENIGALLPWHRLWAEVLVGNIGQEGISGAIAEAESASAKAAAASYREEWRTPNDIVRVWFDILLMAGAAEARSVEKLDAWIGSLKQQLYIPTLTHLARVASRTDSLERYALKYASAAFRIVKEEREDAETKAQSYTALARAILTASSLDAAAYFDEAVKVVSKVGDENLDRWAAMLDLADHAADHARAAPEIAYKLARCVEVTYDYVARDKHFPWEGTVRAIAGLDAPSSFAILSRWRDRGFGEAGRLLPAVTFSLIERGDLDARTALGLIGFRADWKPVQLLKHALGACTTNDDKAVAVGLCYRYVVLRGQSSETWREMIDMLASQKLAVPNDDHLVELSKSEDITAPRTEVTVDSNAASGARNNRDWDSVFANVDLGLASDLSRAYRQFRQGEPPLYSDGFFREMYARVAIGKEPQLITGLAEVNELSLYDLRTLLQQIPEGWKERPSITAALARAVKAFCRRFCIEIEKNRYYDVFPFDLAREVAGVAFDQVVDIVLAALVETTEALAAKRLFTLVGLLATKMSTADAISALSFGIDLFDDVLEDTDGDGPWSAALAPPADMESAVAGYLWTALASPRSSLRWQAAHVTRGLCTLKREKTIESLVQLAKSGKGGAFTDVRLPFYSWHARQWFLIALARAARDSPLVVLPYMDLLVELGLNASTHVLIRAFASSAALEVLGSGAVDRQPELELRLGNVNTSPFPTITSDRYERFKPQQTVAEDEEGKDPFYFDIDAGTYWFAPLGRCFGISEKAVERGVKRVIREDLHYAGTGRWDEDERHSRRLYREWELSDSRSDPRSHDLQFYITYHAVMISAGKLLPTTVVHRHPDYRTDEFSRWLSDNGLVRTDGGWLADRRDPKPREVACSTYDEEGGDWRWSVRRADFDEFLILPNRRMNVWADWTSHSTGRQECVKIRSALVSPSRSHALLNALQSAAPYRCGFPATRHDDSESEDEAEIQCSEFRFQAWIGHHYDRSGLDEGDPWAGDISYPPDAPAQHVIDVMGLEADLERRWWRRLNGEAGRVALWSQVWGEYRERERDVPTDDGERLQCSHSFIQDYLSKVNMDLIVKVQIQRHHHSDYERGDYEFRYPEPSARFFLVKADGRILTI